MPDCISTKGKGWEISVYKGKVKKFKDTIHGYIEIPEIIVSKIIDTEQFQRLRYIEQTSMRPLYPAARHDRFIHSLGVYWLGKQAFKYFRQNSQKELTEDEMKKLTDKWWDKQELLFSLACLLHDCAHAPFSHTLEALYILRQRTLKKNNVYGLENDSKVSELDVQLLEECKSDSVFAKDFFAADSSLDCKGMGAPHEKMSAYCVTSEYKETIKAICKEFFEEDVTEEDIVFIVRMIIGCVYTNYKEDIEKSVKNCIISMLNSTSIDVDGLDYIVRDAYMSGIDNFNIDYQRLLGSFTIIPVEVLVNQKVENVNFDGIWLKGTQFQIERFKANTILGKLTVEGLDDTDAESVKGLNCQVPVTNGILSTKLEDEIRVQEIQSGRMCLKESCKIHKSKFSGTINWGKRIVSPIHPKLIQTSWCEYILGYDKNSLSIIQSTVEARNHEYLWVYTHPKVLYSSNYLQWELLRDSAKYLCCCANNKQFAQIKLTFDCEKCEYYKKKNKKAQSAEEDLLLYIMGYATYFRNSSVEHGLEKTTYNNLVKKGYVFYRTSDDDLNALFKRIYVENKERGERKSDKLEYDFTEFFSRNHRKALWKSFVEYDNFLKMCEENDGAKNALVRFYKKVISSASIYKNNYAGLSPEQQELFTKYGITDVVIIKSSVKTKELNPNETFIKFKDQTLRLHDIFDRANRKEKMSKDFYYIFANFEKEVTGKDFISLAEELEER